MKSLKMLMMAAFTILSVSAFAQNTANHKTKSTAQQPVKNKYSCVMHPEIVSNKPGKCSKCGMDLIKSKKGQMKMEVMKTYTCPMHASVTSKKPGKCPECGMALTVKNQ